MEQILGMLIVSGVGLAMLVTGIVLGIKRYNFIKQGATVDAKILDYQVRADGNWAFVFEFTTYEGRKVVAAEREFHNNKMGRKRKIGKTVQVIYDRNNPMKFCEKDILSQVLPSVMLILAGLLFLIVGIFVV